ncbi:hypothetical protein F3Y22_tig00019143pilonHSYRG00015 [Hibiscus syriacus]|uniref:BED-type domain-containing protein n=1 Tax=Hibiscus syriacus TaxID=106335 RepID=A0A6A3BUJ6_HIBSY|nr:hypothetical protein F3Y22_tig00019143pilonHSYRG00015 [Hibiscus syriacus]
MTSVYLRYFETAPDWKTRRCKFCGQSYSIATATGNLGRHFNNRHPGYDKTDENVTSSAPMPTAPATTATVTSTKQFLEVFKSMREDVRATLEQKVLLDICHVPYPCTGSEIYQSPMKQSECHTLKEDLDVQKMGPFCFIPCARTLSLIIDDALRTTKPVIAKMEAVVSKNEEMLDNRMLNAAEKNIVHNYLEPLYKVVTEMCRHPPTIEMVVVYMDHIYDTIPTRQLPDWLKNAAEDIVKKLTSYNNQVCNIIYMTAILDPRAKCELIPKDLNSENNLEEATAHFVNSTRYPRLSSMARDFLAVQATSVKPEEMEKQRFSEIDCERLMEMAAAAAADISTTGIDKKPK